MALEVHLKKRKENSGQDKNAMIILQERKILIKITKKRNNTKNLVMQRKFKGHKTQENLIHLSLKYSYSCNIQ